MGEQVLVMRVSRVWENWGSPRALGEQVQVMRVSRRLRVRGVCLVLWGSRYSL